MNAERRTQNAEFRKGRAEAFFVQRSAFCVLRSSVLAVTMLALACSGGGRHGNQSGAVGPAMLERVYLRNSIEVAYLLFLPPAGSRWSGGGGSFAPRSADLHQVYRNHSTRAETRTDPVEIGGILGTTLRASGSSFNLRDGNVLVLHVSPGGSLAVTQLPGHRGPHEPTPAIVSSIKAALPHDALVQSLP